MTTINFNTNGTFSGPLYNVDGVTITGSADVVDGEDELGIAGGDAFFGNALNRGETILFSFDSGAATDVSYELYSIGKGPNDTDGDNILGEATLEAFGVDDSSLGIQEVAGTVDPNVSQLFGGVSISKFQVTAIDVLGFGLLNFTPTVLNQPPTAVDDTASAYKGVPTTIAASTLLANDTDPDAGTTLKITDVSNATNGTVSLNSNGDVVFTAANTGDASFQYTTSDGSLTATADVAVSVGLSLNGGSGIDVLKGSDRDDLLNGNGGADALYGNKGKDTLNGSSGNDLLLGGDGDDILNGDDSADALYGGKGNDKLTGGASSDLFADGSDKIGLVGLRFSQLTISGSGSDTLIKYGSETLATLTGVNSTLITAADFIPA